ncbi:hypothetical protein QR680_013689 [Steinernema hermaphroditum]|uniref:Uncharacterized protein n=1 Tax=Steinernema hermaphroditum TaxID=289476 RepID=A0AA39M1Y5_9BILA|nr:hypothetical protein QR680_013689 [Steinernema hermaphroditum]
MSSLSSKRTSLCLRLFALVLVIITMALILAAPGYNLCSSVSVGSAKGSGCSSVKFKIDVSQWDKVFPKKVWGQIALFGLPLIFSIGSLLALTGRMSRNAEVVLVVLASLISFACGATEIWYATGFGTVGGSQSAASITIKVYVYIAGWCAAAAFLLLNGIVYAIDAWAVHRRCC